ncbi:MAG: single-stranded-DNA-specific exonuclease RecJ [Deltaproteobacteria bacterium]|nr:single-stranded-DNA-specific exonuclease RecJ [Deltaproteobacteria bacterium]
MIWRLRQGDEKVARSIAERLEAPLKVGALMARRGFGSPEAAAAFLSTDLKSLPDPLSLPGMEMAVELLYKAFQEKTLVAVSGDYDADGLTATALLKRVLESLGLKVATRIPHRLEEGYGLSPEAVGEIAALGAGLLITVDSGVSDIEAAREAERLGLAMIITDHHELPPELPKAAAIVNPHLGGEDSAASHLAGVGVAFMLAWAARKAFQAKGLAKDAPPLVDTLALVALGTIADLAPLVGANRTLTRHGLDFLSASSWPGLAALKKVSRLGPQSKLSVKDVGFKLAPRLNAAGRLGSAEPALELLLADNHEVASELARALDDLNRQRFDTQGRLVEEALEILEFEAKSSDRTVVLAKSGWPKGLLGLAASRVAERSGKPTVMFSIDGDLAVGSGRTSGGFNLFEALSKVRGLCLSMGGHSQAAGLKVLASSLDQFKEAFERAAATQERLDSEPEFDVDLEVRLEELQSLAKAFEALEPFGQGHPSPVVVLKGVKVLEANAKSGRLTLRVSDGLARLSVGGYNLVDRLEEVGPVMDLALVYEADGVYGDYWRLADFRSPHAGEELE